MMQKLYLGVSEEFITPKIGTRLFGYNPNIYSKSINDDLTSTAFVFEYENKSAVMVSSTVGAISKKVADKVRSAIADKYDIPFENIMLAATHTHSAPPLVDMEGWGNMDEEYAYDIYVPNTIKAIENAIASKTAVTVGMAQGESYVGVNRRQLSQDNTIFFGQNPYGVFNPTMTVISFRDENNNTVANIVHYGCHATAAGYNTEVTRDWPGVMTDALKRETGAVTAFFNGTFGDAGPRLTNGLTTGEAKIEYAMQLGAVATQDAVRIFHKIKQFRNEALDVCASSVYIGLQKRVPLEEASENYEKYSNETININAQRKKYYADIIESYKNGYTDIDKATYPQTIIKIGDTAFVEFPFEMFGEIGIRIDQYSHIPYVLSLSNVNNYEGYFVTQDQYVRGGYEIDMFKTARLQPFCEDADYVLICETLDNLKKLK